MTNVIPLPSNPAVTIRPVRPDDGPGLRAMAARCSPAALLHRFFSPVREIPPAHLREVLSGRSERDSLVAVDDAGAIVALATAASSRSGEVELGVLVEDAWHHHGIARRLVGRLVARAAERGVTAVQVVVQADQGALVQAFDPLGAIERHLDGPTIDARISLSA